MIDQPERLAAALLTVEAAARVLQLGRSKVYELIRRGDIPTVRIDGSRRVRARDLQAYIDELGTQPGPSNQR